MPSTYILNNQWLVYPLKSADQQAHIEQSERLLTTILPGDLPILSWSLAATPGIVLGFSQKPDLINAQALLAHPIPLYHRRAGGTAVLVGPHLLALDVFLPAGHKLILHDIVESYRWLGEVWVETLRRIGAHTRLVSPQEAHAQRDLQKHAPTRHHELLMNRACYGTLSPYEVVSDKRKVVGFDMIRRRAGSLLQAGVLLQWETQLLATFLGHTQEEQALLERGLLERAIGLNTLVGREVTPQELITIFEEVLTSTYTMA